MTAPDCVSPGRVPSPPQGRASRKGVALVVVLAFVVLLTGIVVAFLTRALSQKQIATTSANQTTAELFAQGALDTVVGDLKTEITTLSTATSVTAGGSTVTLYSPSTAAAASPALVASTGTDGLENLLKISKSGAAFFPPSGTPAAPTVPARAANLPTGAASLNGRFISPERWNAPLLVAKQNPDATATTPVAAFPIPDWVLVARDGSNPTGGLPGSAKWSSTDPNTVIGRYAYAIYNEGGLLDINSAGYPSGLTTTQTAGKMALAFADLTQINPDPATQTYLNQKEIDAIVGWRNYASAQPLGAFPNPGFLTDSRIPNASANFYNFIRLTPNGIIPPANTTLFNGQSDRTFSSRQQLLSFLSALGETSTPSRRANLQNAAQYLGTFSRVLNQPSFRPDPNRPKVVAKAYIAPAAYSTGNDAYLQDDKVNPWFRTIRVRGAFSRNDGSVATQGEPLVRRRFALNRLAWLTCKGPSANLPPADILYQQYVSLGIPPQLLSEGTQQNIRNYFGLVWTPGPGSGGIGGYWTYIHDFPTKIATLENVRDAAAKREPDFFELLKAGTCAGSLAKTAVAIGSDASSPLYRFYCTQDTLIDNQIIQLGANMIDQASPDSFPTRIVFDNGTWPLSFYGVDDLPYLHNEFNLNILVRRSAPVIATGAARAPVVTAGSTSTTFVPPEDPGLVASVLVPTIWNPHSPGAPVAPGLAPTQLRICTSMRSFSSPTAAASSPGSLIMSNTPTAQVPNTAARQIAPWSLGTYDAATGSITMPASGTAGNTAMTFSNDPALYREPTPLVRPGAPVDSNLALESQNAMATSGAAAWINGIPEVDTGVNYIGFYIGQFPLRWKVAAGTSTTTYTTSGTGFAEGSNFGQTVSLEYQAGGRWIPYIQTLVPHRARAGQIVPFNYIPNSYDGSGSRAGLETFGSNIRGGGNTMGLTLWDPRSRRWTPSCNYYAGGFINPAHSAGRPLRDLTVGTMIATFRPDQGAGWGTHSIVSGGASQDMNVGRVLTPFNDAKGYITDPDGVIRRAMGGLAPSNSPYTATTSVGLPLATVYNNSSNTSNRPILLHRPFRSVAELGYVFTDTPWRNIDFSKPESGTAALLDVFCVSDPGSALVSGRVDLNTRQAPVLKALLVGAGRDELSAGSVLSTTEADAIARALVSRTTDTATVGKGPLSNIADLVGRYGAGFRNGAATNASQPYDGFSKDLGGLFTGGATSPNNIVSRHRESVMRALSDTGQAGTWNLLIDLVAQVGRYPTSAVNAQDFVVEGEKRYWLHVAIDRQTAQVIDQQLEPVTE